MHALVKVEAFVLKKKALPGQDVVITFFSDEIGKITAIAKGIKKITSRRAGHLQTGNLLKLVLHKSHDYWYVRSSEIISGFTAVRTPEKTSVIYQYLFILDRMLPEGQPEYEIYNLTKKLFINLSQPNAKNFPILEEILSQTLIILGYTQKENTYEEIITIIEKNIEEKLPRRDII